MEGGRRWSSSLSEFWLYLKGGGGGGGGGMCKPVRNSVVMVYKHHKGPIRYSFYSLPLEEEEVAGGSCGGGKQRRRRRNSSPVKLFELSSKEYPIGMGFTFMEKLNRLYLMGGQFLDEGGDICISRKVFSVELGDISTSRQDSSTDLTNILPLSVCEAPRMRSGKGNPIVITAYDKIYVLASAYQCKYDPNAKPLRSAPFNFNKDDMTLVDDVILFEVFDHLTEQWTALPGPDSLYYDTYSNSATKILGHVVANDLIILNTYVGMFLAFNTKKQVWTYFDRNNPTDIDPYSDHCLLLNLAKDGLMGDGVVVDENTLYVFNNDSELATHHIATEEFDVSWFLGEVGVKCPFSFKIESTGGLMLLGQYLVYLGQDKLCCVSCDYPTVFDPPEKALGAYITIFRVNKEKCSCGTNSCRANVSDSYALEGINTKLGSILYCFPL